MQSRDAINKCIFSMLKEYSYHTGSLYPASIFIGKESEIKATSWGKKKNTKRIHYF